MDIEDVYFTSPHVVTYDSTGQNNIKDTPSPIAGLPA